MSMSIFLLIYTFLYSFSLLDLPSADPEVIKAKLSAYDFAFVTTREIAGQAGQSAALYSAVTVSGAKLVVELKFKAGMNLIKVTTVRVENKAHAELTKQLITRIVSVSM